MFKTRLISGIVLVALAIFFIVYGGNLLWGVTLILSLIGMSEVYRVLSIEKSLIGFVGYLACIAYYFNLLFKFFNDTMLIVLAFLIIVLAVYVFTFPKFHANQVFLTIFGFFYVGVMLSFLYQTRLLSEGKFIVWLIFLCSWGCDTAAYCVGVLFGKHKMSPILSPKKINRGSCRRCFWCDAFYSNLLHNTGKNYPR